METTIKDLATFTTTVSHGVSLVDFWAEWCGPCRMQGRILEEIAGKLPTGSQVLKINVDEQPDLAAKFQVRSIPTLLMIKDGEVVTAWVGVQPANTLLDALKRAS